jgi:hypothetical protein
MARLPSMDGCTEDAATDVAEGPRAWIGLGAAGTLHPTAFGRCPHPAGIPPGPTGAGVKVVPPRRRRRRPGTARRLRGLHLAPGSGRMVPATRVGRSALRAAAPAGRGNPADQGRRWRPAHGASNSSPPISQVGTKMAANRAAPRIEPPRSPAWPPNRYRSAAPTIVRTTNSAGARQAHHRSQAARSNLPGGVSELAGGSSAMAGRYPRWSRPTRSRWRRCLTG